MPTRSLIQDFFDQLHAAYGPQGWWPGDTRVEIVVGAILTQNTSWTNVEYAIENLKSAGALDWNRLRDIDAADLAELIRPAGYYNVKARRLKCFVDWLWEEFEGNLSTLARLPLYEARRRLLLVNGIGAETADSILLYALDMPIFVIDAYTGRVLRRHGLAQASSSYDDLQKIFHGAVPADPQVYNEYHALIVRLAKTHCRVKADCADCPLAYHAHNETLR